MNVLFGIGAPFLVYNLRFGLPVQISEKAMHDSSLTLTAIMLLVTVVVFLSLCLRHVYRKSAIKSLRKPALTLVDGVVLGGLYVVVVVVLTAREVAS